jgi:ABC-type multidrug transport system permease subunit
LKGLTPFHYLLEGIVSAVVHDQPVTCADKEFARLIPPPGQTCQNWMGPYMQQVGGYLRDPGNTTLCEFCRFSNGDQYVMSLTSLTLTEGCVHQCLLLSPLEKLWNLHVLPKPSKLML